MLSFPSLWSTIYVGSEFPQKVIQTLLQRSGSHPLDMIIPERHASASRLARYSTSLGASAHMYRIRKLSIYEDSGENDAKHLFKIFSRPAPNLTHLQLVMYGAYSPISIPSSFGSDFPKLRKLEVLGVAAWPEVVGTNLTHIVISSSFDPPQLTRCIPYSPNLRVLEIEGIHGHLAASEMVALPAGIHLTIRRSSLCPKILRLFELPSDGHLQIEPSLLPRWAPGMPFLFWVLPHKIDHLQNLRTVTGLHMDVWLETYVKLRVKCFRQDQQVLEANIEFSPDILDATAKDVSPAMGFLNNLDGIVLGEVEELRMGGFSGSLEPHVVELEGLLTRMPALARVITTDHNEEQLRHALDVLGCRATVVRVDW
jgi:hypothetical protein